MSEAEAGAGVAGLPETLPLFPLSGALLLPGGQLPLNVFEPRYLEMVEHALAAERLIGMVQPTEPEDRVEHPHLYEVGCAGRITAFAEAEDERYLITLTGVCRFRITAELPMATSYRRARVVFTPFRDDMEASPSGGVDRERLLTAFSAYVRRDGRDVDWDTVKELDDATLVTTLAMACPFAPSEKQALLEAADVLERARALTALIEMAALSLHAHTGTPS